MFLTKIREWTKQPVALLLDDYSGHNDGCVDPLGQVTVFKQATGKACNNCTKLSTTANFSFTDACGMCWSCIW